MLLWQCTCGWAGARTVSADEEGWMPKRHQSGTTARVHIELMEERKARF